MHFPPKLDQDWHNAISAATHKNKWLLLEYNTDEIKRRPFSEPANHGQLINIKDSGNSIAITIFRLQRGKRVFDEDGFGFCNYTLIYPTGEILEMAAQVLVKESNECKIFAREQILRNAQVAVHTKHYGTTNIPVQPGLEATKMSEKLRSEKIDSIFYDIIDCIRRAQPITAISPLLKEVKSINVVQSQAEITR